MKTFLRTRLPLISRHDEYEERFLNSHPGQLCLPVDVVLEVDA